MRIGDIYSSENHVKNKCDYCGTPLTNGDPIDVGYEGELTIRCMECAQQLVFNKEPVFNNYL